MIYDIPANGYGSALIGVMTDFNFRTMVIEKMDWRNRWVSIRPFFWPVSKVYSFSWLITYSIPFAKTVLNLQPKPQY